MIQKKHIAILLLLAIIGFWSACDKIEPPYTTNPTNDDQEPTEVVRKFVIEKFTGHRCPGCPEGDNVAYDLKAFYGDNLIVISMHAGFFSNPLADPYTYDFRTPEATELLEYFGVSALPAGMVNRIEYEGQQVLNPASWPSAISEFTGDEPAFSLRLSNSKETETQYTTEIKVDALSDSQTPYHLVVVLLEDNVVKPQRTNDPNVEDGVIMDYEHNNVFRKGITGIWGEELDSSFEVGANWERGFSFAIKPEWMGENCYVVAYIFNAETLEIVQAERVKL